MSVLIASQSRLSSRKALDYIEVLKPLPSVLLTFIGAATAVVAGEGQLSSRLWLVIIAVFLASAGANGLTNYLDRDIDARMNRTRNRTLPSKRIYPPRKVLPLIITFIGVGLALAWVLHPLVFISDLVGTIVAATWRKKVTCVYPQGFIASCAPILMGWFAIKPALSLEVMLLCVLIAFWLPLHVWSVMITHREDYLQAGLSYFPIGSEVKDSVKVLFSFSLVIYAVSVALYFAGGFSWLYLTVANILGAIIIYASYRLVRSSSRKDSWRLYKLSSIPYLGLIFLAMCIDLWL